MWAPIFSGLMAVFSQNLFQATCCEAGVIKWVYVLEGSPLKFGRVKKRRIFSAISDNVRLWSRISPECIDILLIGKEFDEPQPPPSWAKKIRELWSTNEKVIGAHTDPPKWTFFGRHTFQPLSGIHTVHRTAQQSSSCLRSIGAAWRSTSLYGAAWRTALNHYACKRYRSRFDFAVWCCAERHRTPKKF